MNLVNNKTILLKFKIDDQGMIILITNLKSIKIMICIR